MPRRAQRAFDPPTPEQLLGGHLASKYVLRLYVAGSAVHSIRAIENVRQLCSTLLRGRSDLYVIDLHQQPALAKRDRIVIVPTLIRVSPKPTVTLVGEMSNTKKLLRGLGIDLKTGEEESRGQ